MFGMLIHFYFIKLLLTTRLKLTVQQQLRGVSRKLSKTSHAVHSLSTSPLVLLRVPEMSVPVGFGSGSEPEPN
jgi:hypothetical protein